MGLKLLCFLPGVSGQISFASRHVGLALDSQAIKHWERQILREAAA